jgi:NAD(P)-dependent dehydrogenase (short-subunit alcohol dehydrogenase family)
MFTYALARRLAGTGVTATVLHPGVVRTNFGVEDQSRYFAVLLPLVRPLLKSPARGAATPIYLASSADVEGVSGRYFANRKPARSAKASHDTAGQERLWQISADLVGLTTNRTTT